MYYLGKLRRTREFVLSKSMNYDERDYWDKWFGKCNSNNTLLPFLDKKRKEKKTWLFAIKEKETVRVGLCAISEDSVGRKYPFITHVKYQFSQDIKKQTHRNLFMFYSCFEKFETVIKNGFVTETYLDNFVFNNEKKEIDKFKQSNLFSQSVDNIISEELSSIWFEIHSDKFIKHDNFLTCYLYNKILGE